MDQLAFLRTLGTLGVELPVRSDQTVCGNIVDKTGQQVLVVDVDRERPDHEVEALCNWIACAINLAGGIGTVEGVAALADQSGTFEL